MSAHTPGPWVVLETVGGKRWVYSGNLRVAKAASNPPRVQRDANERLIASAPDLLAALKALVAVVGEQEAPDVDDGSTYALAIAQDAIAKAEGR